MEGRYWSVVTMVFSTSITSFLGFQTIPNIPGIATQTRIQKIGLTNGYSYRGQRREVPHMNLLADIASFFGWMLAFVLIVKFLVVFGDFR